MNEWNDPTVKVPAEGESVEIRLVDGMTRRPVLFSDGRFWKFRKGNGGHEYTVKAWRSIEVPKRVGRDDGSTKDSD